MTAWICGEYTVSLVRGRICQGALVISDVYFPSRFLTSSSASSHVRQAGDMVIEGPDANGNLQMNS